jgi:hypothetical protein
MATSYRKHCQLPPNSWKIQREQMLNLELEQMRLKFFRKYLTK